VRNEGRGVLRPELVGHTRRAATLPSPTGLASALPFRPLAIAPMSTPGILPAGALGSRLQAAADFPSRAPFLFPRSWPAALCPPWRPALGGSLWGADRPSCRNTHSGPGASINPRVDAAVFGAQPDALLTTDSIDLSEAQFDFGAEIEYLQDVLDVLIKAPSLETKVELLLANPRAAGFFQGSRSSVLHFRPIFLLLQVLSLAARCCGHSDTQRTLQIPTFCAPPPTTRAALPLCSLPCLPSPSLSWSIHY